MSKPRKPTRILELTGARKQNPGRFKQRDSEPPPAGPVGEPPEHLTDAEADAWREVTDILPDGVAGLSDRIALERLARLVTMARTRPDEWTSAREKDLLSLTARFGMTPVDRAKIHIPRQVGANPWDDL